MANEARIVELTRKTATAFTCAHDANIPKGTLLKLSASPRTVAAADGVADVFAGIAAMEKIAADGSTSISVWDDGIFELAASGAITAGTNVCTSSVANTVKAYTDTSLANLNKVVGVALADASGDKVVVKVGRIGN